VLDNDQREEQKHFVENKIQAANAANQPDDGLDP